MSCEHEPRCVTREACAARWTAYRAANAASDQARAAVSAVEALRSISVSLQSIADSLSELVKRKNGL